MMYIKCPWCGPRNEEEFTCGGQSHIQRPGPPDAVSDERWAHYLFDRVNPMGLHLERWRHSDGCRQWFNLARDTLSHNIVAVYKMGAAVPAELVPDETRSAQGVMIEEDPC